MPIANQTVNAVAMTVLPDAPVDAVTGLQVPTIAVATAGGTSVIKHNGTVVNSSVTHAHQAVDIKGTTLFVNDSSRYPYFATNIGGLGSAFPLTTYGNYGQGGGWQITLGKLIAAARNQEYGYFGREVYGGKTNEAASIRSLGFRIANTFNTGHLIGDIRRAYLADVDVGSASGTEVGGTDLSSGWDSADARWTYSASSVSWAGGGGANSVIGKVYLASDYSNKYVALTFTISGYSGSSSCGIDNGVLNTVPGVGGGTILSTGVSANGTYTFYGYWRGGGAANGRSIALLGRGTNNFTISGISVKEVVADRSYKAQAASITGTLTKTQVALAAQTVSYSGFSAANYLREPYSADLDFGTGEWSASAWVNVPVTLPVPGFGYGPELLANTDLTGFTSTGSATINSATQFTLSANGNGHRIASQSLGDQFGAFRATFRMKANKAATIKAWNLWSSITDLTVTTNYTEFTVYFYASQLSHVQFLGFYTETASPVTVDIDTISVKRVLAAPIFERSHSSGAFLRLGVIGTGQLTATAFDGTNPARTVTTTAAYNTATWLKARAFYTTDGTLGITVNGVEVATTRGAPLLTLNNSNAVLTIGNSFAADAPFPGSIALLKFSATVPTAEQALWMYEQEKQMFRDGAQVTLPDAGSIVDLTYDDATDKWIAVSATNESEWSGLVRTSVMASPAGSYTKTVAASGIQMHARSTTNPGVDINIPAYGLREELVNRSQAAARLARNMVAFDYVGGFTANTTTGATSITGVASLTYPVSYVGARISGAGIPANTTVVAVSGTTIYISAAATATASGVQISFVDFNLPLGYEAREVLTAGLAKIEGATKDFTRLFDGFKETIRFGTAPGYNAAVQIQATRSAS